VGRKWPSEALKTKSNYNHQNYNHLILIWYRSSGSNRDALAMFLLLSSPAITLRGVTVNFGNVSAPVGYGFAREVLSVAGSDIPLFQGAESRSELGRLNPAVEFMIETMRANPGQITLLGVAPLTNIATAIKLTRTSPANWENWSLWGDRLISSRFPG
jgi:inosine-uridine nucleoside N-ribohydrolase